MLIRAFEEPELDYVRTNLSLSSCDILVCPLYSHRTAHATVHY